MGEGMLVYPLKLFKDCSKIVREKSEFVLTIHEHLRWMILGAEESDLKSGTLEH